MIYKKSLRLLTAALTLSALVASAAPEQPATQLSVRTNPEGAQITVNHSARGRAPLLLTDLPPGRYLVHAARDGFEDAFENVTVEAGGSFDVSFEMQPLTGLLLMVSEPEGAEVSSGGIAMGNTPLLITTLPQGIHRLSLALPGYQTKEISVNLKGRTPLRESVRLLADSGTVTVDSDPPGAEVLINGIARGTTPCRIERIPGGSVKLEIRQAGFIPHSRDIALAAGEEQRVNVALQPLPGSLTIVSIPAQARVYVNNEFKGESPCTLDNTEPGEYRVRVEMPGHTPVARNVTVLKGQSSTEEFRLEKNTGILTVITAPAGCTILVDGKKQGITSAAQSATSAVSDPLAIEGIIAGEHTVEIIRKGYAPQKRTVTIERDRTTPLQIKLVRQFIPNYEITTTRSYYKGVLEFANDAEIRIETAPGVIQSVPMKDVIRHGVLKEE